MHLGPVIRRKYMQLYVPDVPKGQSRKALVVGVVDNREYQLLEGKGYETTKADLQPRNDSIIAMDLTKPGEEFFEQFDLVIASDVLEHIPDDCAAVKGIYDLLKPGGLGYIHVPGGNIHHPLTEHDLREGHVRHGYREEQIREVIERQPFTDIRYLKTFNPIEREAYRLCREGKDKEGLELLETAPSDGQEGKSHLFLLIR